MYPEMEAVLITLGKVFGIVLESKSEIWKERYRGEGLCGDISVKKGSKLGSDLMGKVSTCHSALEEATT